MNVRTNTKKSITIKDVAAFAGVSTATVSRALSNPEAVTEATRASVLEAARRTGYQMNQAARNLRRRQTQVIVVLLPNLGNPFFSRILSGIEATASAAGMNVLIVDTSQSETQTDAVRRYLSTARADGLIVMDGSLPDALLEPPSAGNSPPPIVFACEWSPADRFASVRTDNRGGAHMAVKHLIDLGHRDIGFVAGPRENVLTIERRLGLHDALKEAGLELPASWDFQGDFSLASGANAAHALLEMDKRPTAVFCASDMMAIGLISTLKRAGIETPGHISVVAFDDIDIAPYFVPALSTIRQPREMIGSNAAALLIDAIRAQHQHSTRQPVVLPVELIVRESTKARS